MNWLRNHIGVWLVALPLHAAIAADSIYTAEADIAGEVTQTSVILQSRLTATSSLQQGELPGAEGWGRFDIAVKPDFSKAAPTIWLKAQPDNDYIVRTRVTQLRPNTQYYYRLVYGADTNATHTGPTGQFKTLPAEDAVTEVSFVVGQSMNYSLFHYGTDGRGKSAYRGTDLGMGYPVLEHITYANPTFMVFAGNSVYYDYPLNARSKLESQMRRNWHEQLVQPRLIKLLGQVPTYWEKNDHDYRFDDADNSGERAPTHSLGSAIFLEQVPVVDPASTNTLPYRTYRINRLLQIWLLESRDFRSSNNIPDGPNKTLWGLEQREWLKQTLLTSEATFKMVITPTPLIDPDDPRKNDNHTNPNGFKNEANEFFTWLGTRHLSPNQVFFIAGDRHWQYHTRHPSSFEEFGCGNLMDGDLRPGARPKEGDGDGVRRFFVQPKASGGYLLVTVKRTGTKKTATARFAFYNDSGLELYSQEKTMEYR